MLFRVRWANGEISLARAETESELRELLDVIGGVYIYDRYEGPLLITFTAGGEPKLEICDATRQMLHDLGVKVH